MDPMLLFGSGTSMFLIAAFVSCKRSLDRRERRLNMPAIRAEAPVVKLHASRDGVYR